jgi:DNA ligase-1
MREFSQLLERLVYTRSRNAKLKLIGDYLRDTPDPDRGWAMAALTGTLDLPGVKPARSAHWSRSGSIPCCSR